MDVQNRRASLVIGLALVGLGALFLIQQFFDFNFWGTLWPLLVIGGGVVLLAAAALGGPSAAGVFVPGSIVTTVGLILLVLNATGRWEAWSYAWTLIIAAVGVGLWLHGLRTGQPELRRRGAQSIQSGLVMLLVFGLFFEVLIFGNLDLPSWGGPALLIAAGLFLLLRGMLTGRPAVQRPADRPREGELDQPR
jgi:hypothetical protein